MKRLLTSFGAVSVAFCGGLLAGTTLVGGAWARERDPYPSLDTLARAMATIEGQYVDPVPPDDLVHAAIRGMAHSLDAHTLFLSPDEWKEMQERNEGRWFGVGVELRPGEDGVRITRVVAGGPADLGGVKAGDLLVSIEDQPVDAHDMGAVSHLLGGERGQPVRLGLLRGTEPVECTVVRDQVIEAAIDASLLSPGIGYAHIDHFRQRAAPELAQALDHMEKAGGRPLDGLVLDLRENPGGLLDQAVEVVDLFVGAGPVVQTRGRDGKVVDDLHSHDNASDRRLALAVLIDGGSASASEIVAGALQDLGRATIVGSPSYGKGSVQQVYEFEDGSALKLTVARYYLPSGRTFDEGAGVQPDLGVALAAAAGGADADRVHDDPDIPWEGSPEERLRADPQLHAAWQALQPGP